MNSEFRLLFCVSHKKSEASRFKMYDIWDFSAEDFSQHRSDVSGISVYLLIVFAWPSETRLFVWMVHLLVTSWFILSWILNSHGFCTCSCIKGTQEPSASQGFHFRSFIWQFFQLYLDQQKSHRRQGQTESHRFYLQQPVAALAPLFFADPVGEIPERSQFLSARELLREFGWETTRPRTIVFLLFGELETNFVEGWSRGWKVLFQKRSGIPNAHWDVFCDVPVAGHTWWWHGMLLMFSLRFFFDKASLGGYFQIKAPSGWKVSRDWSGIPRHLDIRFLPSLWRFFQVSARLAEVLIAHGSRTRPSWGLTLELFSFVLFNSFSTKKPKVK